VHQFSAFAFCISVFILLEIESLRLSPMQRFRKSLAHAPLL